MKMLVRHAGDTEIEIRSTIGIMDITPVCEELRMRMTWPCRAVMYLDRDAVRALLPHLTAWVETGKLEVASS